MARPIPVDTLLVDELKPQEAKSFIDITINGVRHKSTKNLALGSVAGWTAGVVGVRVGRMAAFGLGGGVLLLHLACEAGYLSVNWERVREAAARAHLALDRALSLARSHGCFAVGFLGGFFFGVACA